MNSPLQCKYLCVKLVFYRQLPVGGESTRLAPCVPATAKVRITTRLMLCRFSPLSRGLNVMREANEFAPSVQILVREACFLQAAARRGRIYSLGTLCSGNYEGATSRAE